MISKQHIVLLSLGLALGLGPAGSALAGPSGGPLHIGDFNGDTISDVLLVDATTDKMAIWITDPQDLGSILMDAAGDFDIPAGLKIVGTGDFGSGTAADLFSDIVVEVSGTSNTYHIWHWDGTNGVILGSQESWLTSPRTAIGVGDFDGDGFKNDVLVQEGQDLSIRFHSEVTGAFISEKYVGTMPANYSVSLIANIDRADASYNNYDDIVLINTTANTWATWFIDDAASGIKVGAGFSGSDSITAGWRFAGAKPFDNSATANDDLVLQDSSGQLYVWFMNGGMTVDVSSKAIGSSSTLDAVGLGAFGGTNRSDVLLQAPSTSVNMELWNLDSNADLVGAEQTYSSGAAAYRALSYDTGQPTP